MVTRRRRWQASPALRYQRAGGRLTIFEEACGPRTADVVPHLGQDHPSEWRFCMLSEAGHQYPIVYAVVGF